MNANVAASGSRRKREMETGFIISTTSRRWSFTIKVGGVMLCGMLRITTCELRERKRVTFCLLEYLVLGHWDTHSAVVT